MTMNVQQMIEVLQAYERGDRVQFKHVGQQQEDWRDLATYEPTWNFASTLYRIAKPEPKKMKLLAWLDGDEELRFFSENDPNGYVQTYWLRVPAEDKEIEL